MPLSRRRDRTVRWDRNEASVVIPIQPLCKISSTWRDSTSEQLLYIGKSISRKEYSAQHKILRVRTFYFKAFHLFWMSFFSAWMLRLTKDVAGRAMNYKFPRSFKVFSCGFLTQLLFYCSSPDEHFRYTYLQRIQENHSQTSINFTSQLQNTDLSKAIHIKHWF